MSPRKKRAVVFLAFAAVTIGLYAWYVRGVAFERVFSFGVPRPVGDAAHGTWAERAAAPTERSEVGAAELGGELYVVGGLNGLGQTVATVEVYRPDTDSWDSAPDLPKPLHHPSVVSLDGYLYVLGGFQGLDFAPSNSVFVFDPVVGVWQELAPMPTSRGAMGAAVRDGKIYAVGGDSPDGVSAALLVYDPSADSWTIKKPMPTARDHLAFVALGDRIYAIGGRKNDFTRPLNAVEAYDPATDSWSVRGPLPRGLGGGAAVAYKGTIVAFGGEEATRTRGETYRYDPSKDVWRDLTPMPTPRHGLGAAVLDGVIFAAGGGKHPALSVSGVLETLVIAP